MEVGLPIAGPQFAAPADDERVAAAENKMRYWLFITRSVTEWRLMAPVQFFGIAALTAIAIVLVAMGYQVATFGSDMCVRGRIGDEEYPCAILSPGVPADEVFQRLRGRAVVTATRDDFARGAIPVRIGATFHVDARALERALAARSAVDGGGCVCAADFGLPLRASAFDGAVMFGAEFDTAAGAVMVEARGSPAAHATGFAGEVEAPHDAFVTYDTPRARVVREKHRGAAVACAAWCDALLAHVTR